MENPGYVALSRQTVLQRQMDHLANNMANLETPGYKGESLLFVEHLELVEKNSMVSMVQDLATVRDLRQGPLVLTQNSLDIALDGPGYFAVATPAGQRYTRMSAFSLDANRQIVTGGGQPLLSDAGTPIVVPSDAKEIVVGNDGSVSTEQGLLGRIGVVGFADEQGLIRTGDGLYDALDQPPEASADTQIRQGFIEGSNVSGIVEMTDLINTVRSYQAVTKFTEEEHSRQRKAIEQLVSA